MNTTEEFSQFLLMADLSGYTAMTEVHGSLSAAQVVTKFVEMVRQSLAGEAHLAERIGDEVILLSPEVDDLLQTGLQILAKTEAASHFPKVHAGIHYGNILVHDGHYFGAALNQTARLAAHAQGGQILCTREVKEKAAEVRGVDFRSLGAVTFRNIKNAVEIFEVTASGKAALAKAIDPVCRMQITHETAHAHLQYKDNIWYFCSAFCAEKFLEDPEHYAERMR